MIQQGSKDHTHYSKKKLGKFEQFTDIILPKITWMVNQNKAKLRLLDQHMEIIGINNKNYSERLDLIKFKLLFKQEIEIQEITTQKQKRSFSIFFHEKEMEEDNDIKHFQTNLKEYFKQYSVIEIDSKYKCLNFVDINSEKQQRKTEDELKTQKKQQISFCCRKRKNILKFNSCKGFKLCCKKKPFNNLCIQGKVWPMSRYYQNMRYFSQELPQFINPPFGYFYSQNNVFIFSEFIQDSLDQYLPYNPDGKRLSSKQIAQIMYFLIKGLQELRQRKHAWLRIHPSNILLTAEKRPIISGPGYICQVPQQQKKNRMDEDYKIQKKNKKQQDFCLGKQDIFIAIIFCELLSGKRLISWDLWKKGKDILSSQKKQVNFDTIFLAIQQQRKNEVSEQVIMAICDEIKRIAKKRNNINLGSSLQNIFFKDVELYKTQTNLLNQYCIHRELEQSLNIKPEVIQKEDGRQSSKQSPYKKSKSIKKESPSRKKRNKNERPQQEQDEQEEDQYYSHDHFQSESLIFIRESNSLRSFFF